MQLGLTAILDRPVDIHDDGITATDTDGQCHVRRSATYSLDATRVPSITIALDRYRHTILYIRPSWDAPGAERLAQAWDGAGLGFPPTGD